MEIANNIVGCRILSWKNRFVGRTGDLRLLQSAFEEARSGKPRVVAIVSESGFGKTRLAQEFYNWLTVEHDGVEGEGYWPDKILREEDNLRVNPKLDVCGATGRRMPFLWWGLRLSDPGQRNATSASGALPAGIETLQAHLAQYKSGIEREALRRRQFAGGGRTAADVAGGVGVTIAEHILEVATFGTLGIAKAVGVATREHRAASKEIRALDERDVQPSAVEVRARDTLAETVIEDLSLLCKKPPKGFEPIPIVLMIDDAQWLGSDGGMASFLDLLLDRARAENWPILMLVTSWRREWRDSAEAGQLPGKLALFSAGDMVHDLQAIEGLETIIRDAYPGLFEDQIYAIAEKAEGVPRFLDEILLYLSRQRKLFVDRDHAKALTDKGLKSIQERDFAAFIADRLEKAPEQVRRALAIASTQGVNFSPRLVHRVAEGLTLIDTETGLRQGEDPHSFIACLQDDLNGEFRLRAYQEAARNDLGNFLDEEDVEEGLRSALEDLSRDPSAATDRELALVLDGAALLEIEESDWAGHMIDAGAELIRRAQEKCDARTAGEISKRILPLFTKDMIHEKGVQSIIACDAALVWNGSSRDIQDALISLVEHMRAQAAEQQTPDARNRLVITLGRLGAHVAMLDGFGAARALNEEQVDLMRAIAAEQSTPYAKSMLSRALEGLADTVKVLDGHRAARPLYEEQVDILRALVAEQPSLGTIAQLATALTNLGDAVEKVDGPWISLPFQKEAVDLARALAAEQPTPHAKSDLAFALNGLGSAVAALGKPEAAWLFYEEEVDILHDLADKQPTPGNKRALARALADLSDVVEGIEGPESARALREEVVSLQRSLITEKRLPVDRRSLAIALSYLANTVGELDGPCAERPLRKEIVDIIRTLAGEQPTLANRHELATALTNLGDIVEELDGPGVARPLLEERVEIMRALVEEQPTPENRNALSIALSYLGHVVEELDGPGVARPLIEEAVLITRVLAGEQ